MNGHGGMRYVPAGSRRGWVADAYSRPVLRVIRWSVVGLVAASLLAGCGDDGDGDEGTSPPGRSPAGTAAPGRELPDPVVVDTDPAEVAALDNTFDAPVIQVARGTTVRWANRGRQDHDVVPVEGGGWGVGADRFHPGDVYEHTFDEPGTYAYYCTIHGTPDRGMIGTIIVD